MRSKTETTPRSRVYTRLLSRDVCEEPPEESSAKSSCFCCRRASSRAMGRLMVRRASWIMK